VEDTSVAASDRLLPAEALLVGTKGDLPLRSDERFELIVSVSDAQQLVSLKELIGNRLRSKVHPQSMAIPSRARHKDSLVKCLEALGTALGGGGRDLDLRAEDLRIAGDALGRITGKVDVENLLDVIFGEFCIGK
jgi:tRNA modification GTPase